MSIEEKVVVTNKLGLHLRAAAELVKVTSKYNCRIKVRNNGAAVNGKSLLNLIALAASYGSELVFVVEGDDSQDALTDIRSLFINKFGEKE